MFVIHDINDLSDLRLYIHETHDMYHFVNAENVYQTILVRLPPVYVQQFDQTLQYFLSEHVHRTIRCIENQAIALLFADAFSDGRAPQGSLNTQAHPTLALQTPVTNTFVEAIISMDGVLKKDTVEFLYHTVQLREHKIDPPTLDAEKLKSIDLFNLKTVNEVDYNNEEEWFK